MNECKEHKYRVQGEITDGGCPYCEIDRLTAQLAERDAKIVELKDNIRLEIDVDQVRIDLELENIALRTKLAEYEKEVERLKQNIVDTLTERLSDVENARKQAARECLDLCCKIMKKVITSNVGCGDYKHNCANFNELEFMKQVKDKFGLKG